MRNIATKPAVIHKRKEIQQKRIANGVENGKLTAKETAKLEAREAHADPGAKASGGPSAEFD